MASLLDLNRMNWSYYTVPAAFVLVLIPHAYSLVLAGRSFDAAQPRRTEELIAKDTGIDKRTARRIARARAASANGFETIGLFAAGVVAGNVAGVPVFRLNVLTLGYLASRVGYNFTYVVLQDNARFTMLRTLVWSMGITAVVSLWLMAGMAAN